MDQTNVLSLNRSNTSCLKRFDSMFLLTALLSLSQFLINQEALRDNPEYLILVCDNLLNAEVFEQVLHTFPPAVQSDLLEEIHLMDVYYREVFHIAHPRQDDFELIAEATDKINKLNTIL